MSTIVKKGQHKCFRPLKQIRKSSFFTTSYIIKRHFDGVFRGFFQVTENNTMSLKQPQVKQMIDSWFQWELSACRFSVPYIKITPLDLNVLSVTKMFETYWSCWMNAFSYVPNSNWYKLFGPTLWIKLMYLANTGHRPNADSMLDDRMWSWPNINPLTAGAA